MNFYSLRRQALIRDFKKDSLDALVVSNPVNVFYLTGFTGDSSYLIASPKHFILVSDSRFEVQIAEECPGLEAVIRPHDKSTEEALGDTLQKAGLKSVGVESGHCTLAMLEAFQAAASKCTFVPAGRRVEELRTIKDASEVELIRASIGVAERAFAMFKAFLRESDTEKDLADAMESYVRRAGGECTAFDVIAAVGERGALPHAPRPNR
jgi:Xaa-Pro aminopeptidase